MRKVLLLCIISFLVANESQAQLTRYIVKLKNKGATTFTLGNPSPYLSSRAINRRTQYNLAIDSSDLPVPVAYINQIKNIPNVTILNVSKWLNAVVIQTTDAAAITAINALPFVQSTSGIASRMGTPSPGKYEIESLLTPLPDQRGQGIEGSFFNYGTNSFNEIHLHNGEFLHNIGLRGQGMQIAVLDDGFFHYTTLPAFDSVNLNGQILGTWDFVANQQSVIEDDSHGMSCFSTIAANIPGQFIGKAPKASFWLYRTEDVSSEYPIEEFNWACGAEAADSSGANVITTSLGYNTFDDPSLSHTYNDMNGHTTMAVIAAELAAKKGILVFASVGNDGLDPWHFLSSPSDGDSVIAVGAVNTSGTVGGFSSYGPSSDGRTKPDVASVGVSAIVQSPGGSIGAGSGTSFAAPNMAGLGTCLWQAFPEFRNMRIVRALRETGSIFNTPNDRIGYGIPDLKLAFGQLLTEFATSGASTTSCNATITWTSKDVSTMRYEVERKAPGDANYVKVGDVIAQAGSVLANHNYQFDNSLTGLTAGTVSYRIRQVIDTALASLTAVYIDTASINLASSCTTTATNDPNQNGDKIIIQPNPTIGDATLIVETSNAIPSMPITVYDMKGRLVMKLQKSKGPGKVIIDLPVNKLSTGKYIITVYDKQKIIGTADLLKL